MRAVARILTACVGALLAAASLGCGSSGGAPSPAPAPDAAAPATFTAIYAMLYPTSTNARCNFCHGMPPNKTSNGNLTVGNDKATAYAALVGKTSASPGCNGRSLVVAGQPESSLFLQKLSEDPPCGSRMPLGGNLLTDEQREMVHSWIAAGAKDD